MCEDIIVASKIPYTILRMSIVFGPNDDAYITKIIKSINSQHEIMMERDEIRKEAWKSIDLFLET